MPASASRLVYARACAWMRQREVWGVGGGHVGVNLPVDDKLELNVAKFANCWRLWTNRLLLGKYAF